MFQLDLKTNAKPYFENLDCADDTHTSCIQFYEHVWFLYNYRIAIQNRLLSWIRMDAWEKDVGRNRRQMAQNVNVSF